jgi:hypothetical protein
MRLQVLLFKCMSATRDALNHMLHESEKMC